MKFYILMVKDENSVELIPVEGMETMRLGKKEFYVLEKQETKTEIKGETKTMRQEPQDQNKSNNTTRGPKQPGLVSQIRTVVENALLECGNEELTRQEMSELLRPYTKHVGSCLMNLTKQKVIKQSATGNWILQ